MSGGRVNEQERADKLSESIDKLLAGQEPDSVNRDPLIDIARQLANVQYKPSRQAQLRFNRQVNEWFSENPRRSWLDILLGIIPLRTIAAALAVLVVIGLFFQSGVLNRLGSPDNASTPTVTVTVTSTETLATTATITASASSTTTSTATNTSTETVTSSPTSTATFTATPTLVPPTRIPTRRATLVPTISSGAPPTDDHGGNSGSDDNSGSGSNNSGSGSGSDSGKSGSDDSGKHSGSDD
jgi:uncharacterized membrane protein YgcG